MNTVFPETVTQTKKPKTMTTDMTDATSTAEKMTANLSVRANHVLAVNGLRLDAQALGMAPEKALRPILTIGGKTGYELACCLDACKMAYGNAKTCPVHADDELPPAFKELTSAEVKELRSIFFGKSSRQTLIYP